MDRLPTVGTDRLVLRMIGEDDVGALRRIFGDPEVMRYWSSPPLEDEVAAQRLVREIQDGFREGALFQWGIEVREGGGLIGTATLWRWDVAHGRAEVGYALGRESWGCGYMVEALVGLLGRAFGEWGLRRVEADTDPRNRRSLRLLERVGFRREGYMRERFLVGGELQDSVVLGLLGREWRGGGVRESR